MSEQKEIRTGILSMQRIFNYGSFLQAYGLKRILEELGCRVTFVDYHEGDCLIPPKEGKGWKRKISKAMDVFRCRASLREKLRFIKYKKNYAKNYYPYLSLDDDKTYMPVLDLLVVGSDEVFNCVQDNPNVGFSPELFGEGSNANRLISYAASFGNTTMEKLEAYHVKERVASWLKSFDMLSVRDSNSGVIVKALTNKKPEYHLDPVLVYDFLGKCSEIPEQVSESDYMILYGYSGRFSREECYAVRSFADKRGLKVLCIGGIQHCCDRFIDCTPFEVIAYFQHAEYIVTDTFHGSILSIITHSSFASFIRSHGYGNAEKIQDLLSRLKQEKRIATKGSDLEGVLQRPVRYEETDRIIVEEREKAYEYIERQINSLDRKTM